MDVLPLSSTDRVVRVRFNGIVYRRYPQAKQSSDRNYFTCGLGDRHRGYSRLHRDIWKAHHGPIPDGYDVDHIDGDPLNNAVGNLQAITESEHHAKHAVELAQITRERMANLTPEQRRIMSELATEWHRSEAGRAWHSVHAIKVMAAVPMVDAVCERCEQTFAVKRFAKERTRFCGINCKAAARRDSGIDDETRKCAQCGADFTINRYAPGAYCGKTCRGLASRKREDRTCAGGCGTVFTVHPCSTKRYCSRACCYVNRPPRTGVQSHG